MPSYYYTDCRSGKVGHVVCDSRGDRGVRIAYYPWTGLLYSRCSSLSPSVTIQISSLRISGYADVHPVGLVVYIQGLSSCQYAHSSGDI